MIVLMAYGQILKQELLDIPQLGCFNVHGSILPKHRGASPIQQSLLSQDKKTGISVMKMVMKMDAGPVYKESDLPISDTDDAVNLTQRLAQLTAYEVPNVLDQIAEGYLEPREQNDSKATYCSKIKKSDGEIDWSEDGKVIAAKMRAYAPWPGTFTFWKEKRVKILSGRFDAFPGEAGLVFEKDHLVMIGTGNGSIIPEELQMEGKTVQSMREFLKGYTDFVGGKLG
jgi:methionyl-tRNA formyltransferase